MQLCKCLAEPKLTFFKTGVIEKKPEKVCADYKNNEKKEKQMNRTSQGESVYLAILKQLNILSLNFNMCEYTHACMHREL